MLTARFLCALFLSLAGGRAFAAPEIFELRAAAPFTGRGVAQLDNGTAWSLGAFSFSQSPNGTSWDGWATMPNVSLDPDSGATQWTFTLDSVTDVNSGWSATVNATAMNNARNGDHVLWLDFQPGPQANPAQSFLITGDVSGHVMGLVQPGNNLGDPPIVSPVSYADWVWLTGNFGPSGWAVRASASLDQTKPFWIADFTAGQRSPTGATLIRDGWLADTTAYPIIPVTYYLDAFASGDRFTLHWQPPGQSQMVQSLTASPGGSGSQQMGDWTSQDMTGTVSVSGSVALGATYWLTRDSDGWCSTSRVLDVFTSRPNPLQWSLRGGDGPPPPPAASLQTVTFHIATGYGWSATVVQPGGTRTLTPTYTGTFTLHDYDTWGNPNNFYYEDWTAQINPNEPYWLSANGTQCAGGEQWFWNGWIPLGGTAPDYQTVTFSIAAGFGGNAYVYQSGTGSRYLAGSTSGNTIQDYTGSGAPNNFTYDTWTGVLDVTRPFFLSVNGSTQPANETWFYNGWTRQNGAPYTPNWQTVNFSIASGLGSTAYVSQGGATIPLTPLPSGDMTSSVAHGYIEDYYNDGIGTANFFYYEVFSAWVDTNLPYTLTANGITLPPGQTIFANGWSLQGGAKPSTLTIDLTLNVDRSGHAFTVTAPNGTSWNWASGFSMTGSNSYWSSQTFTGYGLDGTWTVTDTATGENQFFNPGIAAYYPLDLSAWWLPPVPVQLQISLSRWGHDLRLRDDMGHEYYVTPGNSQGAAVQIPNGTWVQGEYYFTATGSVQPITGVNWRVVDVSTGESAPLNTANLITWICALQPLNVTAMQTGPWKVQVRWKLGFNTPNDLLDGGFQIQRNSADIWGNWGNWQQLTSGNAADFLLPQADGSMVFHYEDNTVIPGTYAYRISYHYGPTGSFPANSPNVAVADAATLAASDSDGDGHSDAWEMANGTDPHDPNSHPAFGPLSIPGARIIITGGVMLHDLTLPVNGGDPANRTFTLLNNPVPGAFKPHPEHPFSSTGMFKFDVAFAAQETTTFHYKVTTPAEPQGVEGFYYVDLVHWFKADDKSVVTINGLPVTIQLSATGGAGGNYTFKIAVWPSAGTLSDSNGPITSPNGTVTSPDGIVTYTPPEGFAGPVSFDYKAFNAAGNESAPGTVTISLLPFKVNVDGDNTTDAESYPDPSKGDLGPAERAAQNSDDEAHNPGLRVLANLLDANNNGIVGYADGIDKFGNGHPNSSWKFQPMLISVPSTVNFPDVRFVFKYSSSDPNMMTQEGNGRTARYTLPQGKILRIWKKSGTEVRQPKSAHQGGDFIQADQEYTPEQLGGQQGSTTIRLYIEVVEINTFDRSTTIDVEFYPLGHDHPESFGKDRIKIRPCYVGIENIGNDDNE